jgi:hypothetical protein
MNLTEFIMIILSVAGDRVVVLVSGEETQHYSLLGRQATFTNTLILLVHPEGLEPPTLGRQTKFGLNECDARVFYWHNIYVCIYYAHA